MGRRRGCSFAAQFAHSASHSVSCSSFLLSSRRPVRCSNPISASKGGRNVSFAILHCVARARTLVSAAFTLMALLAAAHAAVPDIPTVEGPITGPGEMQPGIRPGPGGTNLEDFGYIMEEYFVSGIAAGQPYKTRLLLRKPPNPNRFSGVLVGEPTHRGGNGLICQFARFGIVQPGPSDSSGGTRTYMSSGPKLDHADLRMPDGGPIYQGYFISSILGGALVPTVADAPVIQMPTQFELHSGNGFRRPDSD